MSKINVAVLRGGPSREYDMSLITGQSVIDVLPEDKYKVFDILIDKSGKWHYRGLPVKAAEILDKADVVFNALHGEYGEDGQVQSILELNNIPFTGPRAFSASISFHKALALHELKKAGVEDIKIQGQYFLNTIDLMDKGSDQVVDEVFAQFAPPYVVKPVKSGSSFGVAVASTRDELLNLIDKLVLEFEEVVVEEYIFGKELTVTLVDNLRDQDLYVAPVLEILKKENKIFDHDSKYIQGNEETFRLPAALDASVKERVEILSRKIYETLGGRHYGRIDMILSRGKDLYFLELNSLPGLGPRSLLPATLDAVGVSFRQFLEHVLKLALEDK